MSNETAKTEIYKDGKLLHTIEGKESPSKAFIKLLQIQSNSTHHALKYEGYKVTETKTDGTREDWKP
jgi:hypothetical protein